MMFMNKKLIIRTICFIFILGCGTVLIKQTHNNYVQNVTAEEARLLYERAQSQNHPLILYTPTPIMPETPTITKTPTPLPTLPPTPTPKVIQPEFEELRFAYGNYDIIGYLRIPGTSIDYPVTRSNDNSFYLNRNIRKDISESGWIFLDYENDVENDDFNTIIYGHNMRQDIMFHSLRYYQSWSFFNEHRYIVFNTIYENHVWEIFSFYRAETSFPYIQVFFSSEQEFMSLAREMKERSMYDTGVEVRPGDHILTLSTCTNDSDDTRFVLNARRLSPAEIPEELRG